MIENQTLFELASQISIPRMANPLVHYRICDPVVSDIYIEHNILSGVCTKLFLPI